MIARIQHETKWVFSSEELICQDENSYIQPNCVLAKLAEYESMTWREIKQKTYGDKNKTCNHFITDLSKLHAYAKKRLEELHITENFFSLRLEGKVRIYGLLQNRVFEIMWYDNKHEIYPIDK